MAEVLQPGLTDPLTNMFGMWAGFVFFLISELPVYLRDLAKGFYIMKMN